MKTPSRANARWSTVLFRPAIAGLLLCLLATAARAQTQPCPETNGVKVTFPPQLNGGWDVKDSRDNIVLADDFPCTSTGPITDIHIWGSWLTDVHGTITNFWLGIYDDVPARVDPTTGKLLPSHPGTNLLWQQAFVPPQFAESPYAAAYEYFYVPTNQLVIGTDSEAWYYCFYPANPFVQRGSANAPTNYWLAARAQLAPDNSLYGWKTTTTPYNDAAVWGTLDATGLPSGNWQSMTNPQTQQPINLAFKLNTATNSPPTNCCPEVAGLKWVQWPDVFNGIDINASQGFTLADDFGCRTTGPITDIRLWGSWLNDKLDANATFILSIWSDVPGSPASGPSHPGVNLWSQTFTPGQYGVCLYTNYPESFDNISTSGLIGAGGSSQLDYLCFTPDPAKAFTQTGTSAAPTNYWLSVYVQTTAGAGFNFGWKSSTTNYNDTAVWGNGSAPAFWTSMFDPRNGGPLNLAFKVNTATNNPPTNCCPEVAGLKWGQWPDVFNGIDINASQGFTLADDFGCRTTGPITDIRLWGSWLNDNLDPNATFTLSIWSDVPAVAGNSFSYPGAPLWSQTFGPGQYGVCLYTNYQEPFYNVGPGGLVSAGGSSQLDYLCFTPDPAKVFTQTGTAAAPTNYWLSVFVQTTVGPVPYSFGWKTSTTNYNDTAVWGNGNAPAAWTPMFDPRFGGAVNLAFKVNTATNNCPVTITCLGDKRVECGAPWAFDPPVVGPDSCCPTPPGMTEQVFTNSTAPCSQSYTAVWTITNCLGQVLKTCSQTVTVVDTLAPDINCTNLVVGCGNTSYTNPPVAVDRCCGTNVTVILENTRVANATCGQTLYQTWVAIDCCSNVSKCVRTVNIVPGLGNALVVPNANASTEGNSGNSDPFNTGALTMRYQQVYAASQFGTVPSGGGFITAISFRLDQGWGAFSAILPAVQINLSTTPKAPDGLDTTFANNVGLNDTVVYSGALNLSSADLGSPAAFDIIIPLATPFWYNPAAGNLLLDVRNSGGGTSMQFDAAFITGDSVSRLFGGLTNATGSTDTLGLVTDFTFGTGLLSLTCSNFTVQCGAALATNPPTVLDACCTNVTVTLLGTTISNYPCGQDITRFWQAVDCCSNAAYCAQLITTVDTNPPVLLGCIPARNVSCGSPWEFSPPIASYSCTGSNAVVGVTATVTNVLSPCSVAVTRFYAATNLCSGAVATCAERVTLTDSNAPIILGCIPSKSVQCGSAWSFDLPTAQYACSGSNVLVGVLSTTTNLASLCTNIVTRVWAATNQCSGAYSTCTEVVTITDTTPPTITCPANIVVYTCDTNPFVVTWPTNVASDTCTLVKVLSTPPSGTAFLPNSTNTVVLTAYDACGNSNACSFTVAVRRPVLGPILVAPIPTNQVVLTWTYGILQTTTNLLVPFADVPGATSPYTNSTVPPPTARFYRLRCNSP